MSWDGMDVLWWLPRAPPDAASPHLASPLSSPCGGRGHVLTAGSEVLWSPGGPRHRAGWVLLGTPHLLGPGTACPEKNSSTARARGALQDQKLPMPLAGSGQRPPRGGHSRGISSAGRDPNNPWFVLFVVFFFFFSPLASSVQSHCSPRVSCPLQIPFPSKHKAKAIQPHVGTPSVRPRAGGGGAPRCHPRLHPPAGLAPPQQLLASGDLALPRQQLPARQLRAVVGRGGVCSCPPREELGGSVRRAAR